MSDKIMPLKGEFTAVVTGVNKECIDESARQCKNFYQKIMEFKSDKKFALNSIKYQILLGIGFPIDNAKHDEEFEKLNSFIKENGLENKVEIEFLFGEKGIYYSYLSHFDIVNFSNRIFKSEFEKPKKVFTGYRTIEGDGFMNDYDPKIEFKEGDFSYYKKLSDEQKGNWVKQFFIEKIASHCNFWDDLLVQPRRDNYFELMKDEANKNACRIFIDVIEKMPEKWAEVIRYNEKLYFLKFDNGDYDFIFPNLKSYHFGYSSNQNLPIGEKEFQKWDYFKNPEWDSYNCTKSDCRPGGNKWQPFSLRYIDGIENYYFKKELYGGEEIGMAKKEAGFYTVKLNDLNLNISNLVTVREYNKFLEETKNSALKLEFENLHEDSDSSLDSPVLVNDDEEAKLYLSWFQKKTKLPVTFLTMERYYELLKPRIPDSEIYERTYDNYSKEYRDTVRPIKMDSGLVFFDTDSFLEIVQDKNKLRGVNLYELLMPINKKEFNEYSYLKPIGSWEKTKGVFRLCYLDESNRGMRKSEIIDKFMGGKYD